MYRSLLLTLPLIFLSPTILFSQQAIKVLSKSDNLVYASTKLKFVEISTKEGLSKITCEDIIKINVGLHYPKGIRESLSKLIEELGSNDYQKRDLAHRKLFEQYYYSYHLLLEYQGKDKETIQRIKAILDDIKNEEEFNNVPKNKLDLIELKNGSIYKGELRLDKFQLSDTDFGDIEIPVHNVKSIIFHKNIREHISLSIQQEWFKTKIKVSKGMHLRVDASGVIDLCYKNPKIYTSQPNGSKYGGKDVFNNVGGFFQAGTLVGRIGENGSNFFIGSNYDDVINEEGFLYLRITSPHWIELDYSGEYEIIIR